MFLFMDKYLLNEYIGPINMLLLNLFHGEGSMLYCVMVKVTGHIMQKKLMDHFLTIVNFKVRFTSRSLILLFRRPVNASKFALIF